MNLLDTVYYKTSLENIAHYGNKLCKKSKDFSMLNNNIYAIGVNILIIGGTLAASNFSFSAVTISICGASLLLIAYNIYRFYQKFCQNQQIQAQYAPYEPIFQDIDAEKYESVWEQLKLKLLIEDPNIANRDAARLEFLDLFPDNPNFDPGQTHYDDLLFFASIMSARDQYRRVGATKNAFASEGLDLAAEGLDAEDFDIDVVALANEIKDYSKSTTRNKTIPINDITYFIQN